jgi:hypothetical protein
MTFAPSSAQPWDAGAASWDAACGYELRSWGGLALCIQAFPASAQTPGQSPDTMGARAEACTPRHGIQGEGTSDVYFPASRRQALGQPLQSASGLQERPAEIPADERSAPVRLTKVRLLASKRGYLQAAPEHTSGTDSHGT